MIRMKVGVRRRTAYVWVSLVSLVLPAICSSADTSAIVLEGLRANRTRDYVRARELFDQACKAGDSRGCFYAAAMFEVGEGGGADHARARALYEQACKAGDPRGCYYAGVMYSKGEGGTVDLARARALYEDACEGGDRKACANLK